MCTTKNKNYPIINFKYELLVPFPCTPLKIDLIEFTTQPTLQFGRPQEHHRRPPWTIIDLIFMLKGFCDLYYLTFLCRGSSRCLIKVHELLVLFESCWLKYAWNGLFQPKLPHEHKIRCRKKNYLTQFSAGVYIFSVTRRYRSDECDWLTHSLSNWYRVIKRDCDF